MVVEGKRMWRRVSIVGGISRKWASKDKGKLSLFFRARNWKGTFRLYDKDF